MAEKRYKKLKTAPQLVRLLQQHYFSVKYLRFGRPLAWVTSGAPVEVLRAMGIPVVYPENFGALCGTREASLALCQTAEVHGYSSDLCSYARGSVGMMYSPQLAPLKGIPRPDVLITCSNICGTVLKWYETAAPPDATRRSAFARSGLRNTSPTAGAVPSRKKMRRPLSSRCSVLTALRQQLATWVDACRNASEANPADARLKLALSKALWHADSAALGSMAAMPPIRA